MIAKAIRLVGWGGGALLSLILPRLTAPYALTLDFTLGGVIAALAGFSLMYAAMTSGTIRKRITAFIAGMSALVGLIAWQVYRTLLLSPNNPTPDPATEWFELALFCLAHAGFFALLAFAYQNGADLILGKLLKTGRDPGA